MFCRFFFCCCFMHYFYSCSHVQCLLYFLYFQGYVCFIMIFNAMSFFIILSCYLIMYISIRQSQAWNSNDTRVAKRMALLVFTGKVTGARPCKKSGPSKNKFIWLWSEMQMSRSVNQIRKKKLYEKQVII